MQRLWDKKETASFLHISERTLDRIRADGVLKVVKVRGRVMFRPEEVESFLVSQSRRG
jgi:hypothetical protein